MEPVSVILAALLAGVAAGGKDVTSAAVKDAYAGLKSLLNRCFRRQPEPVAAKQEAVLTEHEIDPDTWAKPLEKALRDAGADQDSEILAAARQLLAQADPAGTAAGTYDLRGAIGVQAGGIGNTQTNSFSGPIHTSTTYAETPHIDSKGAQEDRATPLPPPGS
jgi:hypothetical protein